MRPSCSVRPSRVAVVAGNRLAARPLFAARSRVVLAAQRGEGKEMGKRAEQAAEK